MDLFKLFSPDYLFASVPGSEFHYGLTVYAFFILLFGTSFAVKNKLKTRPFARIEERFFGGIPARMREFAMLGLIFTFFRDQNVPYLGMRVFLLLIGLFMVAYVIWVYRDYKKNFAHSLALQSNKKEEDKYLPKPKKRR